MKVFLDENLNARTAKALSHSLRMHDFSSTTRVGLEGTDDEDLFGLLAADGFNLIITNDGDQLDIPTERARLKASGLHWLGYHDDRPERGLPGHLQRLSVLLGGWSHADRLFAAAPCPLAVMLAAVGNTRRARVEFQQPT